ncbi:hypothetical protein A3A49_01305 [Candidatus Curtissbacteria bacterium RIFCSPLOWO2_01_FULL_38_11b]|uniref:Uncharacterized protein n=1 Tax=Candidatus Curtissbacteria bacterium RIFCSPLOWO2_01_FULL_38_11b TaxID=1797725 RepID=A0A1F5H1R1_9BACT|nr:MAG: hypothetical protein A3A49_01305 [Candidatus Curtissbacteria bacterium RIFCSPLOWO2_01_FULL_38_11b]
MQNSNNAEQWISILINKDPQISNQGFSDVPVSGKFIGGLAAKVYQIPHPGEDVAVGKLGKYIGLWVEKGNKIYALIFYNTEIVGGVYDQILSTFRFE